MAGGKRPGSLNQRPDSTTGSNRATLKLAFKIERLEEGRSYEGTLKIISFPESTKPFTAKSTTRGVQQTTYYRKRNKTQSFLEHAAKLISRVCA